MSLSLTVDDIMDKQFLTFSADTSIPDAIQTLHTRKYFGACVVDKTGKVLGTLSEKACIQFYEDALHGRLDRPLDDIKVTEALSPDFLTISKSLGVVQAAEILLQHPIRRLAVVESGRLIGQITCRDIVKAVQRIGQI
ncbi:CBS domain-containing protein [bacterium]|nr:CBS domain-containing protein [bacterium]